MELVQVHLQEQEEPGGFQWKDQEMLEVSSPSWPNASWPTLLLCNQGRLDSPNTDPGNGNIGCNMNTGWSYTQQFGDYDFYIWYKHFS